MALDRILTMKTLNAIAVLSARDDARARQRGCVPLRCSSCERERLGPLYDLGRTHVYCVDRHLTRSTPGWWRWAGLPLDLPPAVGDG